MSLAAFPSQGSAFQLFSGLAEWQGPSLAAPDPSIPAGTLLAAKQFLLTASKHLKQFREQSPLCSCHVAVTMTASKTGIPLHFKQ